MLEPLPDICPLEPVNPTRSSVDQTPIWNVVNSYSDAIMPNKKDIVLLFADSVPRGIKMKDIDSQINPI